MGYIRAFVATSLLPTGQSILKELCHAIVPQCRMLKHVFTSIETQAETVNYPLVLQMARMEMDCTLNFSKFTYPSLRQNECTMDYSSCKGLIDVLVLNFKAIFSAPEKLKKKDFCTVLAWKQKQECRGRAPLNHTPYFSATLYWISLWMLFHVLLIGLFLKVSFSAVYNLNELVLFSLLVYRCWRFRLLLQLWTR